MFNNQRQFWASYRMVSNYYLSLNRILSWLAPIDVAKGYNIYQQALRQGRQGGVGVLVMGRTCVDEQGRTPAQFGNAITAEDHIGLGVITHGTEATAAHNNTGYGHIPVTTNGMVMHYYNNIGGTAAGAWRGNDAQGNRRSGYHFFYNDAWLLGGAHGLSEFNLASPRWKKNIWDTPGNRLTATGREIVFLDSHGYRLRNTGLYESLVYTNAATAQAATFHSLVTAVSAANSFARVSRHCLPGSPAI